MNVIVTVLGDRGDRGVRGVRGVRGDRGDRGDRILNKMLSNEKDSFFKFKFLNFFCFFTSLILSFLDSISLISVMLNWKF